MMNKLYLKIVLPLVAISVLLLMVAWMADAFKVRVEPGTSPIAEVRSDDLVKVVRHQKMLFEPVPATIEAKQATIVSSRILARIQDVQVRAGDSVKKGQLLIQLENKDLKSRVAQSNQQIKSIQARLTEAKSALNRAKKLTKSGVLSQSDLDKARANHDALGADTASAKQSLLEAETALDFAQIRSPIDGVVVDRFAEPGDTAQPGIQLLSLYNPLSLRIEAHVREELALALVLDQTLTVVIPAHDMTLESHIEERVPAGDPGSRSFLVKSRLSFTQGLLPGMYARMLVPVGKASLLLVPSDRVVKVGQLDVVWVDNQGKTERRFIRTGKTVSDGFIEVISGLKEGETLLPAP